eukprot:gene7011-8935_t
MASNAAASAPFDRQSNSAKSRRGRRQSSALAGDRPSRYQGPSLPRLMQAGPEISTSWPGSIKRDTEPVSAWRRWVDSCEGRRGKAAYTDDANKVVEEMVKAHHPSLPLVGVYAASHISVEIYEGRVTSSHLLSNEALSKRQAGVVWLLAKLLKGHEMKSSKHTHYLLSDRGAFRGSASESTHNGSRSTPRWGGMRLPSIVPASAELHSILWSAHRFLAFCLFAFFLLHFAAALLHAW